ncbi:MAG: S8 family serine peptidase [Nanoarchaeota archaeon]
MEKFNENTKENIEIKEFSDLRNLDLSDKDFKDIPIEILQKTRFDTSTKWPSEDKLPDGFIPEKKIMEENKNPGLGIKELHSQGIDGRGVIVAIIDQKLDFNHPEYKDSLVDYEEYQITEDEHMSMHGPAVASSLVGKECGVAPGSKLVYKALPGGRNWALESEALNDIIEYNKNINEKEKIRIVSCSIDYSLNEKEKDLDKWINSINKAKEAGIFIIDAGGKHTSLDFTGGGSITNKEDFEEYDEYLYFRDEKAPDLKNVDEMIKKARLHKEYDKFTDSDLKKIFEERRLALKKYKEEVITIPSDYRTLAASYNELGGYMYGGRGGISWATPYLAGVLAMALQIKSDIKLEEFSKIVKETAVKTKKGLKVINPPGIIEEGKKMVEKEK